MFTTVQPHEINENISLVQQYFRLRKQIFFDQLNWAVPVQDEFERDAYDDAAPTYLLWTNPERTVVYGGLRLMPTTGPTLLHDVFHATHGRNPELIAAEVWEGTRMCLDEKAIAREWPGRTAGQGFDLMFVALCEVAIELGIQRLVSNFEAGMARVYRRAGLIWTLKGSADGYGAQPVYCADFEVNAEVLSRLRGRHGLTEPLFAAGAGFRPCSPAMPIVADDQLHPPALELM